MDGATVLPVGTQVTNRRNTYHNLRLLVITKFIQSHLAGMKLNGKQKSLLQPFTAIVHGTAFGDQEFQKMGQAGAKLIWSPQSNLALCSRRTKNIPLALKHGVEVSQFGRDSK